MRADAKRNLDRVIDAACECFAAGGVDVSIDEVARRAGVGHGTVFRRFPTKEALLDAVLGKEMRPDARSSQRVRSPSRTRARRSTGSSAQRPTRTRAIAR